MMGGIDVLQTFLVHIVADLYCIFMHPFEEEGLIALLCW
jgi:hypothetical protein